MNKDIEKDTLKDKILDSICVLLAVIIACLTLVLGNQILKTKYNQGLDLMALSKREYVESFDVSLSPNKYVTLVCTTDKSDKDTTYKYNLSSELNDIKVADIEQSFITENKLTLSKNDIKKINKMLEKQDIPMELNTK